MNKLINIISNCMTMVYHRLFMIIFSIFKIDNKKIMIINYYGKWYWDNWKYLSEDLLNYDYKIYWACKKAYKDSLPKEINYVNYNSIKWLYHLATSKIWINNNRFRLGIRKRKQQFYIQTWHGCIGFKNSGAAHIKWSASFGSTTSAKHDSNMTNLLISNSTFSTNYYRNYYRYSGEILECWCPRNDVIINNEKQSKNKVIKYFWFNNSVKICLYAPTFRDDKSLDAYDIDYAELIKSLKNKFHWEWKLLIRFHPSISNYAYNHVIFDKNIINATEYPDMQELLVASDFMITDYSSCIFDYALSKKPAAVYASDIEKYREERNFAIKLEDSPFPIAANNEELSRIIEKFDTPEYKNNLNHFYENVWIKETWHSCKKITEIINAVSLWKSYNLQ